MDSRRTALTKSPNRKVPSFLMYRNTKVETTSVLRRKPFNVEKLVSLFFLLILNKKLDPTKMFGT